MEMITNLNLPLENPPPANQTLDRLRQNLESVVRGKRDTIELLLCCLAANGHALLEDIPGTGKHACKDTCDLDWMCL